MEDKPKPATVILGLCGLLLIVSGIVEMYFSKVNGSLMIIAGSQLLQAL